MNKMKLMLVLTSCETLFEALETLQKQCEDDHYLITDEIDAVLNAWRQYKSIMAD